ncbi:MAG: hypothetical protein EBZ17_01125 [Actinobacteria bacterium]|nr:hypothetical protein [Actinomycetota bacterium]
MTANALLDLQALDVETRQLNHRRAALEQRTKLDEALAEQARRQVEIDTVAAARLEVSSRQKKAEADAQLVSDKADADESKLYGGEVTGLKDLEALQHEIAMLRERQSGFEDLALEAMMEAEDEPAFGASTVVRFDGSNCTGCPSSMPAMEVDRIKHLDGDAPADCQECGRIVLR